MKILFLQKRLLFPTDSGGKVRTLNVVRHLAQWHELIYLSNLQDDELPYQDAMRQLGLRLETLPWKETPRRSLRFFGDLARNFASPYPFNVDKDYDPALRRRAEELVAGESIDLVICDFVQMARNAIGLPGPPKVLFEHNVEAEIFERQAAAAPATTRWFFAYQHGKMRRFEAEAGRAFDRVIAVSQRDAEIFQKRYGWTHVEAIDTAVDVDRYRPGMADELADRVVFCASMDWPPNQDGVAWFAQEVWPRVRAARPGATFDVVGRNPSPAIRALDGQQGIRVSGTVPDVRPLVAQGAVVVVPLRVGGGTRIKIFEAMALGKAVVSTTLGAEGLPVTSGRDVLLADAPEPFADAVVRLLADAEERHRLGAAARQLVESKYSSEQVARQFEAICLRAVAGK